MVVDPSASSLIRALVRSPRRTYAVQKGRNEVIPGIRLVGSLMARKRLCLAQQAAPLRDEMDSYIWDPNRDDEPIKADDHYCDALRYVARARCRLPEARNARLPEGL